MVLYKVGLGSLQGRARFVSGSCTFFYFLVQVQFGSWQNLGPGLVSSCGFVFFPISNVTLATSQYTKVLKYTVSLTLHSMQNSVK